MKSFIREKNEKGALVRNEKDALVRAVNLAIANYTRLRPGLYDLSAAKFVDHVIGLFEKEIENCGGYLFSPPLMIQGYEALQQLYPIHFRCSGRFAN